MKPLMIKKVYLFFSSLFIFLIHLPFVFAKSKPGASAAELTPAVPQQQIFADNNLLSMLEPMQMEAANAVYDSLNLGSIGLGKQVFDYAIAGFSRMKKLGTISNDRIISIVDFSRPSNFKRLFVIDLSSHRLLFNTYVAHGVNSGREFARQFSNKMESNQSSLGFYKTADTYSGKNGYSLHLQGLERGINDNAYKRDIVVHGADYVSEAVIASKGYLGRSHGCPAIPEQLRKPIIDKIKNGTCLFIYGADKKYLTTSRLIAGTNTFSLAKN